MGNGLAPPLLSAEIRSLFLPEDTEPVLRDIALELRAGELLFLAGEAGSGRSVLCRCLAGVIPLFSPGRLDGVVRYEGRAVHGMRLPELAGIVAYVREEAEHQLFCPTLREDLSFGPAGMLLSPSVIAERVRDALDTVGLTGFDERTPETLSGGESQRAVLASFLTLHPRMFILDRAFSQVDRRGRRDLYGRVRSLCRKHGCAAVIVDERAAEPLEVADRMAVLAEGTLVYLGPVDHSFLPGPQRHKHGRPEVSKGEQAHSPDSTTNRTKDEVVVRLRNIGYRYEESGFELRDINLDVRKGEFPALTGPNGSGKTTLLRILNGLTKPVKGRAEVCSLDTQRYSPAGLSRRVGTCFQNPLVQLGMNSVREEIELTLKLRKVPAEERSLRVQDALKEFRLNDVAELHPYRLDVATMQRTALAAVLAGRPDILLLDEPTSRMSASLRDEIMEIVRRFHEQGGTVILISHDGETVRRYCTRVIEMAAGRIVFDLSLNDGIEAGRADKEGNSVFTAERTGGERFPLPEARP